MFAGIYRDLAGKSECRDFKFAGISCIFAIPVISEVYQKKVWTVYIYTLLRFFKFPYNICRDLQGLCGEIGVQGFQIYGDCMLDEFR